MVLNYKKVFEVLVSETADYLLKNNLKAMILGISGGIDSTVVAAICHEVSKQTGIPLIGRSLPIKNKVDEFSTSKLVGEAFCDDFKVYRLEDFYCVALLACTDADGNYYRLSGLEKMSNRTPIANGNLQARCRMMYLYDMASRHKGLVMSTDNQTEYQLGFWTIHGDVGDFNPLQDLWKTEVYRLAKWLSNYYKDTLKNPDSDLKCYEAINKSMELIPTDGLGISNSDLDQIGTKSYEEVDFILQDFLAYNDLFPENSKEINIKNYLVENTLYNIDSDVINKVLQRHIASEFKRKKAPIYIARKKYC